MPKPREKMTDVEYLRDLADRLVRFLRDDSLADRPDAADVERLQFLASHLEDGEPHF